ncbi:MAG: hypothetical protein K6A33_06095 [Clostridiales bacterium]|nr:hypothetical protein [Clostridiales bacterium]
MRRERFRVTLAALVTAALIVGCILAGHWIRPKTALASSLVFWTVSMIYFAIPVFWGVSVRRRVLHGRIRRTLYGVAAAMALLVVLRCLRCRAFDGAEPVSRLLWYAYSVPILSIPLFSYLAILSIGRSEHEPVPKKGIAVLGAWVLLMAGILTNDLHGLAFRLIRDPGTGKWTGEYAYGPLYAAALAAILTLIAVMLLRLWRRCQLEHRGRRIAVPLGVLALFALAGVIYAVRPGPADSRFIEIVVLVNTGTIAVWEACFQTDLFPMNEQYREMFAASPLSAEIVDENYHVRYASDTPMGLPASVLMQAENAAIPLGNGTRLRSAPIAGGRVFWREDVSEVERMLAALRETGERLAENNELLSAEVELRRRRASVDEENRLYDRIATEVSGALGSLDDLLCAESDDAAEEAQRLAAVCVIGAYVKRRSNLILIGERENTVAAAELGLCLRESLESLASCGIGTALDLDTTGNLTKETAWLAYDIFEEAAELSLGYLSAVRVYCRASEGSIALRVRCTGAHFAFPDDWRAEEIGRLGGALAVSGQEDGTLVSFRFDRWGRLEKQDREPGEEAAG